MSHHLTTIEAGARLGLQPHSVCEALRLGLLVGGVDRQGRRYVDFDQLPPRYAAYLAPLLSTAELRAPVLPPRYAVEESRP